MNIKTALLAPIFAAALMSANVYADTRYSFLEYKNKQGTPQFFRQGLVSVVEGKMQSGSFVADALDSNGFFTSMKFTVDLRKEATGQQYDNIFAQTQGASTYEQAINHNSFTFNLKPSVTNGYTNTATIHDLTSGYVGNRNDDGYPMTPFVSPGDNDFFTHGIQCSVCWGSHNPLNTKVLEFIVTDTNGLSFNDISSLDPDAVDRLQSSKTGWWFAADLLVDNGNQDGGAGTASNWAARDFVAFTAVPEPETYAMLLTGLALLGFAARRRKQAAAV